MTSKIKVNILADGGDNSIITSDGAGSFTASSSLASSVQSVGGIQMTPAFQAYLGSNSGTLTNGVATKIQYNTESWDSDSCYDNATNYRFTPTTAGKYWIYGTARLDATTNFPHDAYFAVYKNGSAVNIFQRVAPSTDFNGTMRLGVAVDMNGSTDYIELFITVYDGVGTFISNYSSSTMFGAYRILGA